MPKSAILFVARLKWLGLRSINTAKRSRGDTTGHLEAHAVPINEEFIIAVHTLEVAEQLLSRGVPFILASGYGDLALPEQLRDQPRGRSRLHPQSSTKKRDSWLRDSLPVSNTRFLTAPLYRTPNHYFFNSLIGGRASSQRGRRSSPASQPTASLFMGSTGIETFSVRSQVEHSKVRSSNPRSPKEMRANIILCLHTGHIGRSFSELMGLSPAIEAPSVCKIEGHFNQSEGGVMLKLV
ncbi:hypothetical protein [Nitrobacter hamburgensis]|uniref:hypothetical protein n=1 Tax=Nitrobacter hamburgensis TaxID=912 RepID=UPI001FD9B705|nr:hypothetical protein [Nitrobacter hamburgensis]